MPVSASTGDDAVNARIVEALASASTGDSAADARFVKWLSLLDDESLGSHLLQRKRNSHLTQRIMPPRTSLYTTLTGQAARTSGHELGRGTSPACDQPTSQSHLRYFNNSKSFGDKLSLTG